MRVVVCGSRSFTDKSVVRRVFDALYCNVTIIHGGAPGADRIAGEVATAAGLEVVVMPADWEKHGKRAGYLRNIEMLETQPAFVIAFWDGQSKGTLHTITEARKRGIPVLVCEV